MLVPVYHKTDVLGIQALPRNKFGISATMLVAWRRYGIISRKEYQTFFPP